MVEIKIDSDATEEGALPGAKTKIRRHSLLITFGNQWNPRAKNKQTQRVKK